ncbi:hypothetical protein KSS87_023712, partial [Heliosperma pusillum]
PTTHHYILSIFNPLALHLNKNKVTTHKTLLDLPIPLFTSDPPPNYPHMDKPCEICGASGYAECILVCHRCKITREHMYGSLSLIVAVSCIHLSEAHMFVIAHYIVRRCSITHCLVGKCFSSKQPSDVTTRFNIRKPPRNTKVQYISPEEAMALESGAQKNLSSTGKSNLSSPGKSNLSCRPTVNRIFASKTEASRCTTIPPKLSAKHNPHEGPPGFTNLLSTRSLPNTLLDKKLSASKDTEKCVVPKQRNRQDSPSVISLSAKKARTTNVNAEEKNKEPPRRTYANKDTSAGMTVHLEKSLSSNAELTSPTNVRCKVQALDHASGQSVEHLPTVSSDKEPPRRPYANKDTSSGMTVHLEKSPKSNVELGSPTNVRCKAQASEHAS